MTLHTNLLEKFDRLQQETQVLLDSTVHHCECPSINPLELINELKTYHMELEVQHQTLKRTREQLTQLNREYETLYELAPCGYLNIDPHGIIVRINPAGAVLLRDNYKKIVKQSFSRYLAKGWQDFYFGALRIAVQTGKPQNLELKLNHDEPTPLWAWASIRADRTEWGDIRQWHITLVDISLKKNVEETLQNSRCDGEPYVEIQTDDPWESNLTPEQESRLRRGFQKTSVQESNKRKEGASRMQAANTALKAMLSEYESKLSDLQKTILNDINTTVRPILDELAGTNLSPRQRSIVAILKSNLDDIATPLSRRTLLDNSQLTPAELRVVNLIQQGKSTKRIAAIMGVATSTVDFHRLNIRRKLNLTQKGVPLKSYLKTLK